MAMISENLQTTIDTGLLKDEVSEALSKFIDFCITTGELLDSKKIMSAGTLSSQITYHFIHEHTYFLSKIQTCL